MAYLVNTPWCVSDVVVPNGWDKATVEKCVARNTGACPSGVTFAWHGFIDELKMAFGANWQLAPKGAVSALPWGNVAKYCVVVDADTWEPID